MKTAPYVIEAVEMNCPECNEPFQIESSFYMTRTEFDDLPEVLTCQDCKKRFKKPKLPRDH